MTAKTIALATLLLLTLAGVIAAGTGNHWWKAPSPASETGKTVPAASAEYGRIIERFQKIDSAMAIGGTIRLYDVEKGGALKESNSFSSVQYGVQYFRRLSYLCTWCDGKLVLVVDTLHRRMQVWKFTAQAGQGAGPATMPVSLLFSDTAKFRLTGTVDQVQAERTLMLHSDYNPEIRVCRVYYDTVSYRLHRTEIEWWKDRSGLDTTSGKVWLAKVEYAYSSRGSMDIGAAIRSYITVGKNGIAPTARYAGYDVKINF